jgi:hypothetical protein
MSSQWLTHAEKRNIGIAALIGLALTVFLGFPPIIILVLVAVTGFLDA